MSEVVKTAAKKPETKRKNPTPQIPKTEHSPSISTPVDRVIFLQRTIGNQAVTKLIKSGAFQAKLSTRSFSTIMREPEALSLFASNIPKPIVGRAEGGVFATVYFGQNDFLLEGPNFGTVEKLTEELRYMPGSTVVVDGHASKEGTEKYNLNLSEMRRLAVTAILRSKPIGTLNVSGKPYGESKPAVEETGKTSAEKERQRAQNRRVEIMIIPTSAIKPAKPISLFPPTEIKPETPEERLERILKEKPPAPPPKRSFSEMFWKKFDDSVDDILSKAGVPTKYRGHIKKGARAAVEKGAEKALDAALDKAGLKDEAKRAIKEAIKAAAEIKFY